MATLPISVLDEALRSHPVIGSDGARSHSDGYDPDLERLGPWLPPAPREADELSFTARNLRSVRDVVARHARRAGLAGDRVPDLCLATHEVALNSVRHGGGWGVLRIWREGADLICEISDRGTITDPLVGRSAPEPGKPGGRGLWLANELCGLVRLRSREGNTVVRLHMST
jgi:anti-sigma regulatory factor (Ser/Thr protein kinase)